MKTKKILFVLLALLLICPVMHSQKSVNQLFSEFTKEKGVTHVSIGKFTMTLVSVFKNTMGVKGVEVWSFDECEPAIRERLNKAIASLKDENYETMVSVNDGNEHTKILVKIKDETIHELIVLTTGDDPAMIRIKGKIKSSDIEKVINDKKSDKE